MNRIVGGHPTTILEHPYILSLRKGNEHIGGASILSATSGLTAAHCFAPNTSPSQYSVMAGSAPRRGDANSQRRPLSRFLRHQRYGTPLRKQNDIALIFWRAPVTFGLNVRPIQLPAANAALPYGQMASVTGWGALHDFGPAAEILRTVSIPLVTTEVCNRPTSYNGSITADMFCAGYLEGGRDSCQGDR